MRCSNVYFGRDVQSPCKECTTETGRAVGCHATCERYSTWRNKLTEERDEIRAKKAEERSIDGYIIEKKQVRINKDTKFKKRKGIL